MDSKYIQQIKSIYQESELRLIRHIVNLINKDASIENNWAVRKLAEISKLNEFLNNEFIGNAKSYPIIQRAIEVAYNESADKAVKLLKDAKLLKSNTTIKSQARIKVLADKIVNPLKSSQLQIIRKTIDVYRKVVSNSNSLALTGVVTRQQASQIALNKLLSQGINTFIDKSGKNWNLASYVEMATRTGIAQASVEGHLDKLRENDQDLVIISGSPEPCPTCEPFEGEVFSISGNSEKYPALADAESEGLFHPNCTHTADAYFEGITEVEKIDKDPNAYIEKQQQRQLERNIRMWKTKEALALSQEAINKAKEGLANSRQTMLKFIKETGRDRKYARETITKAR